MLFRANTPIILCASNRESLGTAYGKVHKYVHIYVCALIVRIIIMALVTSIPSRNVANSILCSDKIQLGLKRITTRFNIQIV